MAACGPRAHKAWLTCPYPCDVRVFLQRQGGPIRSNFVHGQGGAVAALQAWLTLSALYGWARWAGSRRPAGNIQGSPYGATGIGKACFLTRSLCGPELSDLAQVRSVLDETIAKVEKAVTRGVKAAFAIFSKLVREAGSATRRSHAKKIRRWNTDNKPRTIPPDKRATLEGSKADGWGHWAVAQIMAARGSPKEGFQFLVRWAGQHDDTWCPSACLSKDLKKVARQWTRATLGCLPHPRRPMQAGPGSVRTRFRRLVRGSDALGKVWAPPSFAFLRAVGVTRLPPAPRSRGVPESLPISLKTWPCGGSCGR